MLIFLLKTAKLSNDKATRCRLINQVIGEIRALYFTFRQNDNSLEIFDISDDDDDIPMAENPY